MKSKFILNHIGYTPNSTKKIIYQGTCDSFKVVRLHDLNLIPVYEGNFVPACGSDFNNNEKIGDFSAVKETGIYRISTSDGNSRCFLIGENVYNTVERLLSDFFTWQRCGDSLGWNGCCHKGDRIVLKSGKEIPLDGGHHQSSDLRKWVFGTSLGMIGYLKYALENKPEWGKNLFDEEIRHSLKYYLNLISDEGYVYDGTWVYEGYTGEQLGIGYGDYSRAWENRQFYESPAPEAGQWLVIRMLSLAARFYSERDISLSRRCIDGAKKIYSYTKSHDLGKYDLPVYPPLGHDGMADFYMGFYKGSSLSIAGQAMAALEIYKATNDESSKQDATDCLSKLAQLQVGGNDLCAGCFWESEQTNRLANNYFYFFNTSVPIAFVDALEQWPEHKDSDLWRKVIVNIAESNVKVCQNNPYGRVATGWCNVNCKAFEKPGCFSFSNDIQPLKMDGDAGMAARNGERSNINYEYETFCYNLDISALGVFLYKAGKLLDNNTYIEYAHRQLDWLLGFNRFDASNVEGVGYNQPHRGIFGEFYPPVPQIPGGVFVGFTDQGFSEDSFGFDNEYDMPMVGWLMYLLSVLKK